MTNDNFTTLVEAAIDKIRDHDRHIDRMTRRGWKADRVTIEAFRQEIAKLQDAIRFVQGHTGWIMPEDMARDVEDVLDEEA